MAQSAAERRRAQRRLASELHKGLYKQSKAGKASQKARERLTIKKGSKVHNVRRFNTLDNAIDFIYTLPPGYKFYISVRGTFNDPGKYEEEKGMASLNSFYDTGAIGFATPHLRQQDREIFEDTTSYYVMWRNGD